MAKKPEGLGVPVVMERGAKVACYGREGTGKTELVMSSRFSGKLFLLDTEGGSQYYDPTKGYGFEAKYSKSPDDALELLGYAEALHAEGEKVIFGIDSFTSIWHEQQLVAAKIGKTSFGTPKFSSWAKAKAPLKELYDAMFETPVDVLLTMRAKPRYEQKKSGRKEVVDFGYDIPDTERGSGYPIDVILRMDKTITEPGKVLTPDDYYAVVVKTRGERDNLLPIGTMITDPTFAKLTALRLEGAPGGMKFDEDTLLQVGQVVDSAASFKRWVKALKLDPDQVITQLKAEFGEVEIGDGEGTRPDGEVSQFVEWTWNLYQSLKDEDEPPF